jgi:hypothetical protein
MDAAESTSLADPQPLVIYPSRWKASLILVGAVAFVVISGAMIVLPEPGVAGWLLRRLGMVGVLFFGACGAYTAYRLIVQRPALVADDDGLLDNASAVAVGRLRWDEIERVWPYGFSGQMFLGVIPRDLEQVLARLPRWKQALIRANVSFGCAPINIPQTILPVRIDDVVNELAQRFDVHVAYLAMNDGEIEDDGSDLPDSSHD